jgi:hypothetical protein
MPPAQIDAPATQAVSDITDPPETADPTAHPPASIAPNPIRTAPMKYRSIGVSGPNRWIFHSPARSAAKPAPMKTPGTRPTPNDSGTERSVTSAINVSVAGPVKVTVDTGTISNEV